MKATQHFRPPLNLPSSHWALHVYNTHEVCHASHAAASLATVMKSTDTAARLAITRSFTVDDRGPFER